MCMAYFPFQEPINLLDADIPETPSPCERVPLPIAKSSPLISEPLHPRVLQFEIQMDPFAICNPLYSEGSPQPTSSSFLLGSSSQQLEVLSTVGQAKSPLGMSGETTYLFGIC